MKSSDILFFLRTLVKELCVLYHLSASELVEEWIAYVTSISSTHEPDLSTLENFERKVKTHLVCNFGCWENISCSQVIGTIFFRRS